MHELANRQPAPDAQLIEVPAHLRPVPEPALYAVPDIIDSVPTFAVAGPQEAAPSFDEPVLIDVDSFAWGINPGYGNLNRLYAAERRVRAESPGLADRATEILTKGTLDQRKVEPVEVLRDGYAEMDYRIALAAALVRDPAVAETLIPVAGFHGTRSVALAGMLESGGLSATSELKERDSVIASGEHVFQSTDGQGSISFSHLGAINAPLSYAATSRDQIRSQEEVVEALQADIEKLSQLAADPSRADWKDKIVESIGNQQKVLSTIQAEPDSLRAELMRDSFPVLVGVNYDFVDRTIPDDAKRTVRHGVGDMGEFRPFPKDIPFQELPVIAVPESRIEKVRALLDQYGHKDTQVIRLELLQQVSEAIQETYKDVN